MFVCAHRNHKNMFYRSFSALIVVILSLSLTFLPSISYAQSPAVLNLPLPGTMLLPSPGYTPVLIKGITIQPNQPLRLDFIVDSGNSELSAVEFKKESEKILRYFLASLTIPEADLWVNLSPYEEGRIIPDNFGKTELGRDLLAQDYLLKQLTATLIYPEEGLGKDFWERVYKKAGETFGTTDIPVNTFNKVWIVPDKATVFEKDTAAYVVESRLKVMLDEDYKALRENKSNKKYGTDQLVDSDKNDVNKVSASVVREIIIPEIEKEVNEGKNFAPLRQIYHALILSKWYKETLKESLFSKLYVDQNKVLGVDVEDKDIKDKIYNQYLEAYKKGVFNYIKEDYDTLSQEMIPRKYFSGGAHLMAVKVNRTADASTITNPIGNQFKLEIAASPQRADASRLTEFKKRLDAGDKTVVNDLVGYYAGLPANGSKRETQQHLYEWLQHHSSPLAAQVLGSVGINWSGLVPYLEEILHGHTKKGNRRAAARQLKEIAELGMVGGLKLENEDVVQAAKEAIAGAKKNEFQSLIAPVKIPKFPKLRKGQQPGKLILLRHGEQDWSVDNADRWAGSFGRDLSERGRENITKIGASFRGLHIDSTYAANLRASMQSLVAFQDGYRKHMHAEVHEGLNERHYGLMTGWSRMLVREKFGEPIFLSWRRSLNGRPIGGESLSDVMERTTSYFVKDILSYIIKGKNVVVIAHNHSLRAIYIALKNHTRLLNEEDQLSEAEIRKIAFPLGIPVGMRFDENLAHEELWGNDVTDLSEITQFLSDEAVSEGPIEEYLANFKNPYLKDTERRLQQLRQYVDYMDPHIIDELLEPESVFGSWENEKFVGPDGKEYLAEFYHVRVINNTILGPGKGGIKWKSGSEFMKDPEFRKANRQFNNLKPTREQYKRFLAVWTIGDAKPLSAGMTMKTAGLTPKDFLKLLIKKPEELSPDEEILLKRLVGGGKGVVVIAKIIKDENGAWVPSDYEDWKTMSSVNFARVAERHVFEMAKRGKIGINKDVPAPDVNTGHPIITYYQEAYWKYLMSVHENNEILENDPELYQKLLEVLISKGNNYDLRDFALVDAATRHFIVNKKPIPWGATFTGVPGNDKVTAENYDTISTKELETEKGGALGRKEATGFGVVDVVLDVLGSIEGMTFGIQGMGNVGAYAALRIAQNGGRIKAINDVTAALIKEGGGYWTEKEIQRIIDSKLGLAAVWREGFVEQVGITAVLPDPDKSVGENMRVITAAVLEADVNVLIPAATNNVITTSNAARIKAEWIFEGANGPVTNDAEAILSRTENGRKPTKIIPGSWANAGGVLVSVLQMIQAITGERYTVEEIDKLRRESLRGIRARVDQNKIQSTGNVSYSVAFGITAIKALIEAKYRKAIARFGGDLYQIRLAFDSGASLDDIKMRFKWAGLEKELEEAQKQTVEGMGSKIEKILRQKLAGDLSEEDLDADIQNLSDWFERRRRLREYRGLVDLKSLLFSLEGSTRAQQGRSLKYSVEETDKQRRELAALLKNPNEIALSNQMRGLIDRALTQSDKEILSLLKQQDLFPRKGDASELTQIRADLSSREFSKTILEDPVNFEDRLYYFTGDEVIRSSYQTPSVILSLSGLAEVLNTDVDLRLTEVNLELKSGAKIKLNPLDEELLIGLSVDNPDHFDKVEMGVLDVLNAEKKGDASELTDAESIFGDMTTEAFDEFMNKDPSQIENGIYQATVDEIVSSEYRTDDGQYSLLELMNKLHRDKSPAEIHYVEIMFESGNSVTINPQKKGLEITVMAEDEYERFEIEEAILNTLGIEAKTDAAALTTEFPMTTAEFDELINNDPDVIRREMANVMGENTIPVYLTDQGQVNISGLRDQIKSAQAKGEKVEIHRISMQFGNKVIVNLEPKRDEVVIEVKSTRGALVNTYIRAAMQAIENIVKSDASSLVVFDERLKNGDTTVIGQIVGHYRGIPVGDPARQQLYEDLQRHQSKLAGETIARIGLNWEGVVPYLVEVANGNNEKSNARSAARQLQEVATKETFGGIDIEDEKIVAQAVQALSTVPNIERLIEPVSVPEFPTIAEGITPGKLLLVRHGETNWSVDQLNKWAGWLNSQITTQGREDAFRSGVALKDIPIDVAYESGLLRSQETLKEFKRGYGNEIETVRSPSLNERHYGLLAGWPRERVEETFGTEIYWKWRRSAEGRPLGGESLSDVIERAAPYVVENILADIAAGKNVMFSGHNNTLRAIIVALTNHTRKLNGQEPLSSDEVSNVASFDLGMPVGIMFDSDFRYQERRVDKDSGEELSVVTQFLQSDASVLTEITTEMSGDDFSKEIIHDPTNFEVDVVKNTGYEITRAKYFTDIGSYDTDVLIRGNIAYQQITGNVMEINGVSFNLENMEDNSTVVVELGVEQNELKIRVYGNTEFENQRLEAALLNVLGTQERSDASELTDDGDEKKKPVVRSVGKVYVKPDEEIIADLRKRMESPLERGNGWFRVTATPNEAFDFHNAWASDGKGSSETEFNGRTYRIPNSVHDKMRTWFSGNINFERMGYFIAREDGQNVDVIDFVPTSSAAMDPALGANSIEDAEASQASIDVRLFINQPTIAAEFGIDLDLFGALSFDQMAEDVEGAYKILVHSHHETSLYPDGPSQGDQSMTGNDTQLVFSIKNQKGYFFNNNDVSEVKTDASELTDDKSRLQAVKLNMKFNFVEEDIDLLKFIEEDLLGLAIDNGMRGLDIVMMMGERVNSHGRFSRGIILDKVNGKVDGRLVRDNSVTIRERKGEDVVWHIAQGAELEEAVLKKWDEEIRELEDAIKDNDPIQFKIQIANLSELANKQKAVIEEERKASGDASALTDDYSWPFPERLPDGRNIFQLNGGFTLIGFTRDTAHDLKSFKSQEPNPIRVSISRIEAGSQADVVIDRGPPQSSSYRHVKSIEVITQEEELAEDQSFPEGSLIITRGDPSKPLNDMERIFVLPNGEVVVKQPMEDELNAVIDMLQRAAEGSSQSLRASNIDGLVIYSYKQRPVLMIDDRFGSIKSFQGRMKGNNFHFYHGNHEVIVDRDGTITEADASELSMEYGNFDIDIEKMDELSLRFRQDMQEGLKGNDSSLAMLRTFMRKAAGNEKGQFISVNFGGSNLKVSLVELKPGLEPKILREESLEFEDKHRTAEKEVVFSLVANLINQLNLDSEREYDLGFTFSFAMEQDSIDSAKSLGMAGWNIPGIEGENPAELLQDALNDNGLPNVNVAALANDTAATQLSLNADIGLIVGTGFNISYRHPVTGEFINMEAGAFDGIIQTEIDKKILNEMHPKGGQAIEKMISGAYIGEVVRLMLKDLYERGLIFKGQQNLPLFTDDAAGTFPPEYLSLIEGGGVEAKGLRNMLVRLEGMRSVRVENSDFRYIQDATRLATRRAGRLIAAVITAAIKEMDEKIENEHLVAVDGSLYEKHPFLKRYVREGLQLLLGEERSNRITIEMTKNGSGVGAAIAAAVATSSADASELTDAVGGIELKNIKIERSGEGIDIPFNPAELQPIIDGGIDGFAPVIINIIPITNVLPILGLAPAVKEEFEVSSLN